MALIGYAASRDTPFVRSSARILLTIVGIGFASVALGATVTLDKPVQGETASSGTITVSVSLSQDFQAGRDGWVQIWLDGALAMTLSGTSGKTTLAPGNHQIQARLVRLDHQPLRIPANSEQITMTIPAIDSRGN
jgi:hypothetical protein